jgi:hypothetical protein
MPNFFLHGGESTGQNLEPLDSSGKSQLRQAPSPSPNQVSSKLLNVVQAAVQRLGLTEAAERMDLQAILRRLGYGRSPCWDCCGTQFRLLGSKYVLLANAPLTLVESSNRKLTVDRILPLDPYCWAPLKIPIVPRV